MITCRNCKCEKEECNFYKVGKWYNKSCKECYKNKRKEYRKEYNKQYYLDNMEKIKNKQEMFKNNNPEYYKNYYMNNKNKYIKTTKN